MLGCPDCKSCASKNKWSMGLITEIGPTYSSGTTQSTLPTEQSWWSAFSSWGQSAISEMNKYYEDAKQIMNQGMDYAYEKVNEAKELMAQALRNESVIDSKIEMMPDGPDKNRLIAKRNEAKGFFSEYVMPAWSKFASLVGLSSDPESSNRNMQFGAVPLIPIAAVVVALSLSAVAWRYIELQDDILNDPAFSASQKAGLLSSFSIGGLTANLKTVAIAGAVIAVAVFVIPRFVSKKNG